MRVVINRSSADRAGLDARRELCDAKVTLDGKRACISGVLNDFATVTQLPDGLSCEWAWPTVARIVADGGTFRS